MPTRKKTRPAKPRHRTQTARNQRKTVDRSAIGLVAVFGIFAVGGTVWALLSTSGDDSPTAKPVVADQVGDLLFDSSEKTAGATQRSNDSPSVKPPIRQTARVRVNPPPPPKPAYWDTAIDFSANLPLAPNVTGDLAGEMTFIQNTLVRPDGTDKNRPLLVTDRAAYLLFVPTDPTQTSLRVTIYDRGQQALTISLQRPENGAPSDFNNKSGGSPVVYNKRAWTAVVPWNLMHPGIDITVTDGYGKKGVLPGNAIKFGAPLELVTQNIDLGMLVPVSRVPANKWARPEQSKPHELAIDYFQHVPVAKFIAAQYLPAHFEKVVMPAGDVYTHRSKYEGAGVYKGDMREQIAKGLISTGINLANVGVLSSAGGSQNQPRPFRMTTVHTSAGLYTRKVDGGAAEDHFVTHGLSGGGGQLTLSNTTGNEYSHEYGHDHGLGHYPGKKDGLCYHSRNGAWGYHMFKHRLIANVSWNGKTKDGEFPYEFGKDAMAGGKPLGPLSVFTLYTPYSLRLIQDNITKQSGILNAASPTGYSRWDSAAQKLVKLESTTPKADKAGIPVMTLVGFYDTDAPHKLPSYVFPALYGNWGNVFSPETIRAHSPTLRDSSHVLVVEDEQGQTLRFPLSDKRFSSKPLMNQFHINLDASKKYVTAAIVHVGGNKESVLDRRKIAPPDSVLPEPAIVGKESGFTAASLHLRKMDSVLTKKGYPNVGQMEVAMSDYYGQIVPFGPDQKIVAGQTYRHENKYYQATIDNPSDMPGSASKGWRYLGEPTPYISDRKLALGKPSVDYSKEVMKGKSFVHYYVPVDHTRVASSDVSAPNVRHWYGKEAESKLVVFGRRSDGTEERVVLRGQINGSRALSHGAPVTSSSRVRFTYQADDNPDLPKGTYAVSFYAYAHGWHTNKLVEAFEVRGSVDVK